MARPITYDPSTGREYAPGVTFTPEQGVKLIGMARASRLSVRQVLRHLVDAAEIDAQGRSLAVEERVAAQHEREAEEARRKGEGLF